MRSRALVALIPLLLAISCSPAPEATIPPTPTAASEPTQPSPATATLEPTTPPDPTATEPAPSPEPAATSESTQTTELAQADLPTSTPTEPAAPEATETSPPPTAVPTSTPLPAPEAEASGTAGFRDSLAIADQFVLNLSGLQAPPDGQAYQGWLVSDDGTTTSVGVLGLNQDGSVGLEWNSPNSENLLERYASFQVTLEPAAGSPSPTGPVVLAGGLEGEALTNARRLFVRNDGEPATPLNTAFALGLQAQTDVAIQHVQNAVNAAAIGALPEMRLHLEHVVNIIEGAAGPRFGDYNGNGVAENPGDGFGVIGYSGQIAQLLGGQQSVASAAADVQAQSTAIQDKSLAIMDIEDMATASAQLGELKALADQLKADPVARLYQAAQNAVSFEVSSVE